MRNVHQSECPARWVPPEELLELAEDEEGLLDELIEAFQVDAMERMERMRIALVNEDGSRLRKEAHAIKGSSRQIGALALATMCQDLELTAGAWQAVPLTQQVDLIDEELDAVCQAMTLYRHSNPNC